MSLEINYIDAPDGAQESMVVTAKNCSFDPQIVAGSTPDKPWATLEPGLWRLNGTRTILPDNPRPGLWSSLRSGATAGGVLGKDALGSFVLGHGGAARLAGNEFATPPNIIISFPVP